MSEGEKKAAWDRGKTVLARIMKYVSVEKLESLATKIEDPDFRQSMAFKMFMNSLKK